MLAAILALLIVTGGYPKFISQGLNDAYLPIWLQELGYGTYYVGKLFNAQTVDNYASPPAAGWTGSEFLLDPYTYEYLNATFSRNSGKIQSYEGQYTTDLIRDKSFDFLDDAIATQKDTEQPFFLTIAPTAPHTNVHIGSNIIDGNFSEHSNVQLPPIPAERHQHLFPDVRVPRTEHFNPREAHGVSWISRLAQQNSTNLEYNDDFYRKRLQSLQSVDEIIAQLVERLEAAGLLDETYIVYSTDNGYHIGQHRLQPGKQCAFEEDINIPFMIRGPGIPKGHVTNLVTSHTDLAPTFLALAGAKELREDFDGRAIPLLDILDAESNKETNEHVNVEMWGIIMSEGKYGSVLYPNHTYKALRVIGEGYNLLYTVWCSGEHELYDLVVSLAILRCKFALTTMNQHDPYQTENIYSHNHTSTGVRFEAESRTSTGSLRARHDNTPPYHSDFSRHVELPLPEDKEPDPLSSYHRLVHLLPRLDALLMVLKTCAGKTCTQPWDVLHPAKAVRNLKDALDSQYDDFYEVQQERIQFDKCEKGYILESEGPVKVRGYVMDEGG